MDLFAWARECKRLTEEVRKAEQETKFWEAEKQRKLSALEQVRERLPDDS